MIFNFFYKWRPRVHAQRKFAQGQGQSPCNSIQGSPAKNSSITAVSSSHQSSRLLSDLHRQTMHASTGSRSGNHSSSSSTASGPVTNNSKSNGRSLGSMSKGERPKTEDFLTFLCLRGIITVTKWIKEISAFRFHMKCISKSILDFWI